MNFQPSATNPKSPVPHQPPSGTINLVRGALFSQLTAPRRALVRLLQSINFGHLEGLEVRGGEPMFSPAPAVFVEVKLDAPNEPRPEIDLGDFELRAEVTCLLDHLTELRNGSVERIEVRYGVPRRAVIERPLQGVRR